MSSLREPAARSRGVNSSEVSIRRAALSDIDGIGAVVREVWDQEILQDACRRLIAGEHSTIWVAEAEEAVLGFASGFLTMDKWGQRRGEIDLLAVRPSRQGEGIGPRLIAGLEAEAASWGVDVLRALIRVKNRPSQKAFSRVGFTTDGQVHKLFLWSPKEGTAERRVQGEIAMIPVDTVTYRGLWIEGLARLSRAAQQVVVGAARAAIARDNRLNTGALIPADDTGKLARRLMQEATLQGDYYWFQKRFD